MKLGPATGPGVGAVDARRARPAGPPAALSVPAALVGIGIALPLVYLVMRALGAGPEVWDLLLRSSNVEILVRSVVLAAAVTCASAAIAVPLAWLTVRTDLPFRGVWSVVTALPLVIPSYVGAFLIILVLGPKGMLQGWLAPLGVERLPEIFGLPGADPDPDAAQLPLRPAAPSAPRWLDWIQPWRRRPAPLAKARGRRSSGLPCRSCAPPLRPAPCWRPCILSATSARCR